MSQMSNPAIPAPAFPSGSGSGDGTGGANSESEPIKCGICFEETQNPQNWRNLGNCSHGVCTACFSKLPRATWVFSCPEERTIIPRVLCPYCRSLSNCEPHEIKHPGGILITATAEDLKERSQRLITMGNNYLASRTPTPTTIFKFMLFFFKIKPNGHFELEEERIPFCLEHEVIVESESRREEVEYSQRVVVENGISNAGDHNYDFHL